ncbi:hypothetical protein D9758_018586 [Tetrapyrgos nigripes]|uniref:Uncharacterized protein n=1 Tax=Tetrapyrgos nigripes TaxID=182062 RepID=A0A8H5BRQ1_9AGAR|nr:hypothetical protein D9758_018586 [Tetrapyrgos nigripes]
MTRVTTDSKDQLALALARLIETLSPTGSIHDTSFHIADRQALSSPSTSAQSLVVSVIDFGLIHVYLECGEGLLGIGSRRKEEEVGVLEYRAPEA